MWTVETLNATVDAEIEVLPADRRARGPATGERGQMTKLRDLHEKWSGDPAYKRAYDELEEEFALAAAIAEARGRAGLTQEQVAERMHTTQSNIARLEAGRTTPSTRPWSALRKRSVHA